jgi:hypothetical protein
VGRYWWETSGYDDPDWSDFAYYSGSTRASYYSNNAASEEPADTIGIFAPSYLWDGGYWSPPPVTTKTLPVTRVEQGQTLWCWAATAEMVGKYPNTSADNNQEDIALALKGTIPMLDYMLSNYLGVQYSAEQLETQFNQSGDATDVEVGIRMVRGIFTPTHQGTVRTFAFHRDRIDNDQPLACRVRWPDNTPNDNNDNEGHWLVVSGYRDASSTDPKLRLVDPAQNCTQILPYSYADLIDGICNLQSGNNATYTHSVWVS